MGHPHFWGVDGARAANYVWPQTNIKMKVLYRMGILAALLLIVADLQAQISFGAKVGANYFIGSQKVQPEPKNAPTNPKGLGLMFGGSIDIPFSDLVGIRPELGFSFRRGKSETVISETLTNNTQVTGNQGAYTGSHDVRAEDDQRLSYFQINLPLTLRPSEGLRVMVGPSLNFLMGGKLNSDVTTTWKGTISAQGQQDQTIDQQSLEATKKKGSAAIKDFKKADIMVMAGVGYTLPVGFDMDLRFYRGLSPTYDHSESSSRQRIWTNLIELAVGWQFGGN